MWIYYPVKNIIATKIYTATDLVLNLPCCLQQLSSISFHDDWETFQNFKSAPPLSLFLSKRRGGAFWHRAQNNTRISQLGAQNTREFGEVPWSISPLTLLHGVAKRPLLPPFSENKNSWRAFLLSRTNRRWKRRGGFFHGISRFIKQPGTLFFTRKKYS